MAINNYQKYLDNATPNLALQSNQETFLLWGAAGVLSGLDIVSVVNNGPNTDITLSPGSFIHQGIVVNYPEGVQLTTLATPSTFSLSDPLCLIVQSNGSSEGNSPNWSLISQSNLRAQPDYQNFAAVVAVYRLQIVPNSITQQVGFEAPDVFQGWIKSPGPATSYEILNGSNQFPGAYLRQVTAPGFEQTVCSIQNLGGNANFVTQAVITAVVAVDNIGGATTTKSTATVTVLGVSGAGTERFSLYANGIEVFFDAVGPKTAIQVADGLRAAITAPGSPWVTIAVPDAPGLAVITLTSVKYGHAALYDLQSTENSSTTTLTPVQPTGGLQGSIKVDFPTTTGFAATSAAAPFTIYPPVPDTVAVGVFSPVAMSFPIALTSVSASTFNLLDFRITRQSAGNEELRIYQTFITVNITELNNAIDQVPPTQLSHWIKGPVLSVGGGQGTALAAHREANPIDHPDRSIIRSKIQARAVGALEIDQFVVGSTFAGAYHAPSIFTPTNPWWLISSDLNLEECSDMLKSIALTLGDLGTGTSNLSATFAREHNFSSLASSGHHAPILSADIGNATITSHGLRVDSLVPAGPVGDPSIDPGAGGWDVLPALPAVVVTTRGQMAIMAEEFSALPGQNDKSGLLSIRKATGVPLVAGGTGTVYDQVISSPEQTAVGKIGFAIGMNKDFPHLTAAYKVSDIKPLSGLSAINGVNARGFQSNVMSLFSRAVCFLRTDAGLSFPNLINWRARTGGTVAPNAPVAPYADIAVLDTTLDGAGTSFIPTPMGAAFYCEESRTANYIDFETYGSNLTLAAKTSMIGSFPATRSGVTGGESVDPYYSGLVPPYTPPGNQRTGTQWLYLPFPQMYGVSGEKHPFRKIRIKATLFGDVVSYDTSASKFLNVKLGLLAAPAYDAVLGGIAATAPVLMPVAAGTAIPSKMSGIIRRFPWVLTPDGYRDPRGLADNDGVYYDRTTFLVPVGENPPAPPSWPLPRASAIGAGVNPAGSIISRAPMPYYDKSVFGGAIQGVFMSLGQMRSAIGVSRIALQSGLLANINQHSVTLELDINLKNSDDSFVTLNSKIPTGIMISTNRFDYGLFASDGAILSDANLDLNLKNGNTAASQRLESKDIDYVHRISLQIDGVADGNFKLVPSNY